MKFTPVTLALSLVTLSSFAQAIVVDDFSTGPYSVTLSSGSDITVTPAASALGGNRGTGLFVQNNPFNRKATLDIGNGLGIEESGSGMDAFVQLFYGYGDNWVSDNSQYNDLNLDASGGITLSFLENDQPLSITVINAPGNQSVDSATKILPASSSPQTITFFASDFSGSITDIDQLVFNFDSAASGDYTLTGITAVPEPASMAALGLGLAALKRRRAKRN